MFAEAVRPRRQSRKTPKASAGKGNPGARPGGATLNSHGQRDSPWLKLVARRLPPGRPLTYLTDTRSNQHGSTGSRVVELPFSTKRASEAARTAGYYRRRSDVLPDPYR